MATALVTLCALAFDTAQPDTPLRLILEAGIIVALLAPAALLPLWLAVKCGVWRRTAS